MATLLSLLYWCSDAPSQKHFKCFYKFCALHMPSCTHNVQRRPNPGLPTNLVLTQSYGIDVVNSQIASCGYLARFEIPVSLISLAKLSIPSSVVLLCAVVKATPPLFIPGERTRTPRRYCSRDASPSFHLLSFFLVLACEVHSNLEFPTVFWRL